MMAKEVRIAFEQQVLLLALDDILPSKMLAPRLKATAKYKARQRQKKGCQEPFSH